MSIKEIEKRLEELEQTFKNKENECSAQMKYMREHNFLMEERAIRYKQEAYSDCWLEVWNLRFELFNKNSKK